MCNCNCSPSNSSQKFSQRSNTPITSTEKDLSTFLSSEDYLAYTTNFSSHIIEGQERLITFNNTTVQALWLPTIDIKGERQVLFTYYKLNTNTYLTFVVNSKGDFSDLLNMSGNWNLWLPNKINLVAATFLKSAWVTQIVGTEIPAGIRSILQCMLDTLHDMGPGTGIACAFDPEACLLAIGIDCAYQHLID